MAYDSESSEVVLFGGNLTNLTWVFHNGSWSNQSITLSPPGGAGATMAYNPGISAVVLFTGNGATWTFANNTWTEQHPVNSPSARTSNAFFYDAALGGVILWGGDIGQGVTNATWESC